MGSLGGWHIYGWIGRVEVERFQGSRFPGVPLAKSCHLLAGDGSPHARGPPRPSTLIWCVQHTGDVTFVYDEDVKTRSIGIRIGEGEPLLFSEMDKGMQAFRDVGLGMAKAAKKHGSDKGLGKALPVMVQSRGTLKHSVYLTFYQRKHSSHLRALACFGGMHLSPAYPGPRLLLQAICALVWVVKGRVGTHDPKITRAVLAGIHSGTASEDGDHELAYGQLGRRQKGS